MWAVENFVSFFFVGAPLINNILEAAFTHRHAKQAEKQRNATPTLPGKI